MSSGFSDRLWDLLEGPRVGDDVTREQVRAFALFLLVHLTARSWLWDLRDDLPGLRLPVAIVLSGCLALGLVGRTRLASAVAAATLALQLVALWPQVSNHYFLELVCAGWLAFFDHDDAAERRLLLSACRGMIVLVLLAGGLQKLSYGTYLRGEFLGYMIAANDRFRDLFRWLLPPAELERLAALSVEPGSGPFAIDATLAVGVSNATVVLEIALPIALLVPATRRLALWSGVLFVASIQLAARELTFGALAVQLLLLFDRHAVGRRLLPLFAVGYLVLVVLAWTLPWKAFN